MRSQTLPKLTVIPASVKARKKYHYYLHLPAEERRKALAAGIISEQKKKENNIEKCSTCEKSKIKCFAYIS